MADESPCEVNSGSAVLAPYFQICGLRIGLVYAVFSCIQTMVWLPMLGIFNEQTDVNAHSCKQGLYGLCNV